MKDERANIKVSKQARRLINLLAAHLEQSQSDIIEILAEEKCKELNLPIKQ